MATGGASAGLRAQGVDESCGTARDSRLLEPRAPAGKHLSLTHQPCPLTFQGAGVLAGPGGLDITVLLVLQTGRRAWAPSSRGHGEVCAPARAHVHSTHVLLHVGTLAEVLLWDGHVIHGQQALQERGLVK